MVITILLALMGTLTVSVCCPLPGMNHMVNNCIVSRFDATTLNRMVIVSCLARGVGSFGRWTQRLLMTTGGFA